MHSLRTFQLLEDRERVMATGVGDSSTSILKVLAALPKLSTAADVGSGNGRISNHLRKLGWNVSGCEINPELALLAEVDHADARRWQPHYSEFAESIPSF